MTEANHNPLFHEAGVSLNLPFPESAALGRLGHSTASRHAPQFLRTQPRAGRRRPGAAFVDAHTVEADEANGGKTVLTADAFVIATGARPYHPPNVDFDHPRIFDSDYDSRS